MLYMCVYSGRVVAGQPPPCASVGAWPGAVRASPLVALCAEPGSHHSVHQHLAGTGTSLTFLDAVIIGPLNCLCSLIHNRNI